MTGAERVAVLDGRLNGSYGDFDGLILQERARAQAQREALGNDPAGLGQESQGGAGAGGNMPIYTDSAGNVSGVAGAGDLPGAVGGGQMPVGAGAGAGDGGDEGEVFAPPADIPSGRDDDVVARQLREAAMREPDPVLREKLWDEYRRYTGLSR